VSIKTTVKHYAKFLYPGSLFPEEQSVEIPSLDANLDLPQGAFAYSLYSVETKETEVDGETFVKDKIIKKDGVCYIDAVIYTADTLPDTSDLQILRSNMQANGYAAVVHCNRGNWQPFDESVDKIVYSSGY
jgi:hypothetical protein